MAVQDPNNPFNDQLVLLNGVTFAPGTIWNLTSTGLSSVSGGYFSIAGAGTMRIADYGANPGQLSVVSYTYEAAYGDPLDITSYHLPVFGVISFSGYEYSGTQFTFAIRGFSSDGMLLSLEQGISGSQHNVSVAGMAGINTLLVVPEDFDPSAATFPLTYGPDPSVLCFAAGTRIATDRGPVAVEDLAVGDLALTASGEQRPVKWIGQIAIRPDGHARPADVNPVRVRAQAFGPATPAHDVRLSPGHAVMVDGVLVPVSRLINGATIVQESVDEIRYFHVELDSHDVLLAEGLACESYLDDGNREHFDRDGDVAVLHPRLDPLSWDKACAPMVADGPQLIEIQRRLHAQAEALGWTKTEEPDLRIEADGVEIAPVRSAGGRHWFAVPVADVLILRSNAAVLGHALPGVADARRLGVAVAELRVDGAVVPLEAPAFGPGFHPEEGAAEGLWRWSDGAARLELGLQAPALVEIAVAMVAPSWVRPVVQLRSAA